MGRNKLKEYKNIPQKQMELVVNATAGLAMKYGMEKENEIIKAVNHVAYYVDQYNYQRRKHKNSRAHLNGLADAFHKLADNILEEAKQLKNFEKVTCKGKSCNACCRMAVCITVEEAMLLIEYAQDKNIEVDVKRLKEQAGHTNKNWHEMSRENTACVFLGEDGGCQVYKHRPLACRNHFSADNPEYCDIQKYPEKKTAMWSPLQSQLLSTAITIAGDADYMPEKLLEAMKVKTKR